MNRKTGELVKALYAVTQHVPRMATELLAGTLPVTKQHEFAGLLVELGELLHSYADDQDAGSIPGGRGDQPTTIPGRSTWEPGGSGDPQRT